MTVEEASPAPSSSELSGRGRRYLVPTFVLLVAIAASVLFAALTPTLAPTPTVAAESIPPLPAAPTHPTPAFDTLADHFPFVDRSVSDPASRQALVDFAHARLLSPAGAGRMFLDAWHGLAFPAAAAAAVRALELRVLTDHLGMLAPTAHNGYMIEPDPSFSPVAAAGMVALRSDPGNADRLNNVGVALYLIDAGNYYGAAIHSLDGVQLPTGGTNWYNLQASADWVWQRVQSIWSANRAANLNVIARGFGQASWNSWIKAHRGDAAPTVLAAASAQSPTSATTILQPLLDRHATAPIGDTALADVDLNQAISLQSSAPYQAAILARRALDLDDRAIALSGDPAGYEGRARALSFLGQASAAIIAERIAAKRSRQQLDALTRLAYLQQAAGDLAGMQHSAREVLARSSPWNPPDSMVLFSHGLTTFGFLPMNFSNKAYIQEVVHGGAGAGGAYILLDTIPRYNATSIATDRAHGSSGVDAIYLVATVDMLRAAPSRLHAHVRAWMRANTVFATSSTNFGDFADLAARVTGARMLNGGKTNGANTTALEEVSNNLRYAGRFGAALHLCQRFAALWPHNYMPQLCAGESQFFVAQAESGAARRTGLQAALAGLQRAAVESAGRGQRCTIGQVCLEAATAAQIAASAEQGGGEVTLAHRDLRAARRLYADVLRVHQVDGTDIFAELRLGDLDLVAHRLHAAVVQYALALRRAAAETEMVPIPIPLIQSSAANNTGIALLEGIQASSDQKPDCAHHSATCKLALGDFQQARTVDLANPVFAMNVGWVSRLLGREDEARTALASAIDADPALYPALNDLGVIEMEAGEISAARQHFEAALAANPGYDLAAWNLGVLDMREGPSGVLAGQAYLARAIAHNRSLRGNELEPLSDERTYQYLAGVDVQQGSSLGRNYSIGSAAFGWIALLAALYQAVRSFLTDKALERIADWWDEHEPEWRKSLARRLKKLKFSGPKWVWRSHPTWQRLEPWVITVPVLAIVTTIATTRTAPGAVPDSLLLLAFVTGVAILTHETGHLLAAVSVGARLKRAVWPSGVTLALALSLIPLEMNTGPYLGHEVEGDEKRAWQVYLGGPLANILVAALCYGLYLAQPLPLLRLMTQVQLAVCAYSLLPIKPLDGEELEHKPRVLLPIALLLTIVSIAFVVGWM